MKKTLTLILIFAIYQQIQAQDALAKKILAANDTPSFRIVTFLISKSNAPDRIKEKWTTLINDSLLVLKEQNYYITDKQKPRPEILKVAIKELDFDVAFIKRNKYALTAEENKSHNLKEYSGKYFEIFIYTKNKQKTVMNERYYGQNFISLSFNTYEEANAVLEYLQKKADKDFEKKFTTASELISKNFKSQSSKSLSTYYLSAKDDFSTANIPTTKNHVYTVNNKSVFVEEKTSTVNNKIIEKRTQKVELNKLDLESFSVILVDSAFLNPTAFKNKKKTKLYLLAIDCKENLPYCITTTVSFAPGETNSGDGLYLTFASAIEAKAARWFLLKQLGK